MLQTHKTHSLRAQDRFRLPACIYMVTGTHPLVGSDCLASANGLLDDSVQVCLPLCGGKGGYGNQLRAIGRKGGITDNVGDCRDLSGRRLRDIQAMQDAALWKATQKDRDDQKAFNKSQEAGEKKQKREEESQVR